ncbi:MAG: helix-turn-helix domain-containing protein [Proteobacteria bacterium]|nr:helix-turn-helix domain-containing protein [Pseudomonadota bacterium]
MKVAKYLKVDEKTIYRLLEKGEIPTFKVGKQWRFILEVVRQWVISKHNNLPEKFKKAYE